MTWLWIGQDVAKMLIFSVIASFHCIKLWFADIIQIEKKDVINRERKQLSNLCAAYMKGELLLVLHNWHLNLRHDVIKPLCNFLIQNLSFEGYNEILNWFTKKRLYDDLNNNSLERIILTHFLKFIEGVVLLHLFW